MRPRSHPMPRPTTRPTDTDEGRGNGDGLSRLRRLLSPASALAGVFLLVAAARAAGEDRRRATAFGIAAGALLGLWHRREAAVGPTTPDPAAGTDVSAPTASTAEKESATDVGDGQFTAGEAARSVDESGAVDDT